MKKAGSFGRPFIKGGVKKKFIERTQRINNIYLSILVLDNGGAPTNNTNEIKRELDDVNNKIDDLYGKLEENKVVGIEQIVLPPKRNVGAERNQVVDVKVKDNAVGALPAPGISQIKLNEASKLFMEGYWAIYGHGWEKNIDYAIELLEESEKLGHIGASMELGKIYEEGLGVQINLYDAFVHYHNAAQKREPHGLFKVGDIIEKGVGGEENEQLRAKQIVGFYKTASAEGSTKAKIRLAQITENGEFGYRVDKNKALEYYESVVDEEEEAMNRIGMERYEKGDYRKAVELFTKAAENGNANAINNLGTCCELGKGIKRDILRAYDLYEEAANKGDPQAMANFGFLFYK